MAGGLVNISARPRNFACVQLPAPGEIISVNLSCMSVTADGDAGINFQLQGTLLAVEARRTRPHALYSGR